MVKQYDKILEISKRLENLMPEQEISTSPDASSVISETVELLGAGDISSAIINFRADTEASQIALEFVKSYAHFVQELVDHDLKIKLQRSDIEIRDLISHVNMLMRKKYELTFTAMVYNSPSHYRKILEKILSEEKDNQESK